MKKTILISLLVLALVLAVGCAKPKTPTPSPSPMAPVTSPAVSNPPAATTPAVTGSPAVTDKGAAGTPGGNGTAAGGVIEGFEEGKTVKEADLPEKVTAAIKKAYKDVKIKAISFATYMNDQVYHVVLEEPAGTDKTEQFYVKADGTVVPYGTGAAGSANGSKS